MFTLAFDEHRMKNSLPCRFSDTQTLKKIYADAPVHNKDRAFAFPVLGKVRRRVVCSRQLFSPVHLPEFGTF